MSFLTKGQQKILIYAMENEGIIKKDQSIYNSKYFYDTICFLKKNGLIVSVCWVCKKKLLPEQINLCDKPDDLHWNFLKGKKKESKKKFYKLTLEGELIALALSKLR